MAPLREEVKNLDSYVSSIEKFYALKADNIYKETVNELLGNTIFDTTNDISNLKNAANAVRNELKQLPADMVRPGVVEQINDYLDKKIKLKPSS